ncbi:hypothetical protein [Streptomyces sp. NPDC002250]|uniref:hypothetical protein n=1 Tax=Streptomyces sp. NPDC002250 TaxID=3364641 RepID=UPI0036A26C5D
MGLTDELTPGEKAMERMNAALGGRLVEEYRRGAEWVLAEIKHEAARPPDEVARLEKALHTREAELATREG